MCASHENPHPRRRERAANRKLSRPRIVPRRGHRSKLTPGRRRRRRIMYTRDRSWSARGDSSRYSLLMGVLFSGALGPPGTCHAPLGSGVTMLVTPAGRQSRQKVRELLPPVYDIRDFFFFFFSFISPSVQDETEVRKFCPRLCQFADPVERRKDSLNIAKDAKLSFLCNLRSVSD